MTKIHLAFPLWINERNGFLLLLLLEKRQQIEASVRRLFGGFRRLLCFEIDHFGHIEWNGILISLTGMIHLGEREVVRIIANLDLLTRQEELDLKRVTLEAERACLIDRASGFDQEGVFDFGKVQGADRIGIRLKPDDRLLLR
jgi:hypothetical protein